MLQSLRGNGSRLQSYSFEAHADLISALESFSQQINSKWDESKALQNYAEQTERDEDVEAYNKAKREAIALGNQWIDYTKQAERHFESHKLGIQFFSVVANILSSTPDVPDELILPKESARKFRDGKQSASGRVFGAMQFNSIGHYMGFRDYCIAGEEALNTIPAYAVFAKELAK